MASFKRPACYLLFLATIAGNVGCQIIFELGPQNITRMEGDTDVVLLCPYCTNYAPPTWVINGTSYATENLPRPPYYLTYGGLLISLITRDLNNTSYRCFYPDVISGSPLLQASTLGILTVIRSSRSNQSFNLGYSKYFSDRSLTIDHQLLLFENNATTWAWKVSHNPMHCDVYELEAKVTCNNNSTLNNWNITGNRSVTVPVFEDIDHRGPFFYNFIGRYTNNNICQVIPTIFQVNETVITKKLKTAVAVTEDTEFEVTPPSYVRLYSMGLALPSDSNDKRDCLCPILISEIDGCYDFNCDCIGDTIFGNILNICHRSVSNKFVLILKNMTMAMNNTRFHVYINFFCNTTTIRQYVDSLQIMQVLPATPHVKVITNNQHFEVCILSEDILTDFYEIALHDVTGELLVLSEHNNAANCTNIYPELNKPNLQRCAPFMLNVSAINPFGVSSKIFTVQNGTGEITNATKTSESNICSCFKQNVQVSVALADCAGLSFEAYCNDVRYESNIMLHIGLGVEAENFTKTFTCTDNDPSHLVNFEEVFSTYGYGAYNVTLYWVSSKSDSTAECIINEQSVVVTNCSSNHMKSNVLISVLVPIVVLVLILASVILVIYYGAVKIKGNKTKNNISLNGTYNTMKKE